MSQFMSQNEPSKLKRALALAAAILASTALTSGCAKSDKNDLKETQLCLNTAATNEAMSCLDKISGDNSGQAFKLRCSAVFISEGYGNPTSFTDAIEKINGSSGSCTGGCSSTVSAISSLSFKNTDNTSASERTRTNALADQAFSYCSLSETNIYLQISSLFKIGTLAANTAYQTGVLGTTPTETEIKDAIAALSPSQISDIGNIAITTYNATCLDLEKASDAIKKYCAQLGTAVAEGDATSVGTCLKSILTSSDPNQTCP